MNEPEILDSDIRALQQWLRTAWKQLGDPSLTAFARRELRNQMKQCSADLRAQLERMAEQQAAGPAAGHELHQARSANPGLVKHQSVFERSGYRFA
jgi:IS5 family transposase